MSFQVPSLTHKGMKVAALVFASASPSLLHAAPGTFQELTVKFLEVLNLAITLLIVLGVLAFIYGAIRFIAGAGDERARTEGKQVMIWGVLSLFFMVGVWGVVRIIYATFFG